MSECICLSCKHLKTVLDEKEDGLVETCEFGFPSEGCLDCELDSCDLVCAHFEAEAAEAEEVMTSCVLCGKSLVLVKGMDTENNYCLECYLNK